MYGIVPVCKIGNVLILIREIGNVPSLTLEIDLMRERATYQ